MKPSPRFYVARWFVFALALALALTPLVDGPTWAADSSGPTCTTCHRASAKPEDLKADCNYDFFCLQKYYTPPEGMHANFPCTTCHPASETAKYPHAPATPVNCTAMCHKGESKALEATVHNSAALHGVEMTHPIVGKDQSACLTCHPPHAGHGHGDLTYAEYNPRSRPCLACHVDDRSNAPQVGGYEHSVPVFDLDGVRWEPLGSLPLFDHAGQVVDPTANGALTCNSCHSNHGPDSGPDSLRRPGWQRACAACHGADALALYRYFHKPERRAHIVVPKFEAPAEQAEPSPVAPLEDGSPAPPTDDVPN